MELSSTILLSGDPSVGLAMLAGTTVLGGAMGAHMTASIGGETLPVPPSYSAHEHFFSLFHTLE